MRKLQTAALIVITATTPAWAEDIVAPAPDAGSIDTSHDASHLEQIVVTANRAPLAINKVGSSITVITDADLRQRQVVVLSDILAQTPGVALVRNGGTGSVTSLFIRGADGDQTAVVIDGVKLNDPSAPSGAYDFADLLVGDVERVEILRGA